MRLNTHVVLVSDQPTPNITPLLDGEFRPARLIMVVSPDKKRRAEWMRQALQDTGIAIETWPIDDAWDIGHIRDRLLDLLAACEDENIVLNVTGGTKLMAIAAYEVFFTAGKPIFYVHPETDSLVWVSHPDRPPPRDLADRIKLPRFLLAHGARLVGQGSELGVPEPQRRLADELVRAIGSYRQALGVLNWAAQTAEERLISQPIKPEQWRDASFQALLDLFQHAGMLAHEGRRLVFPDEASRFHANGGWLENHVYGLCLNQKKSMGIQDIGRGLQVEWQARGGATTNEIDVALLRNNRLHVIECKTRRFGEGGSNGNGKGTDALYKLDSLTDLLGGLKARAMFVSYRQLNRHDLLRAGNLRIAVCHGEELKDLSARLSEWIAH